MVFISYLPTESKYQVIYYENEHREEKTVYVTYAVNRINPFQTKITGMRVELIE